MPEADWLRCVEPQAMLLEIAPRLSDRQLRLFAAACCRRVWQLLPEGSRRTVELAERYADGLADAYELRACSETITQPRSATDYARAAANSCADPSVQYFAFRVSLESVRAALLSEQPWSFDAQEKAETIQCSLLRDIAGNPFAPVEFSPPWRTRDVLAIAQRIYQQHDFAALPILADALTDAGCEDSAILNHCEQPHHARGCWLLDRIRGMK